MWFLPQQATRKQSPFFFVTLPLHSRKTNLIILETSRCLCVRCIRSASSKQPLQSFCYFSEEHAIAVGGCHRDWLSHFHTLFTAHYYLSITCNYPSWWLMECFRGWVGKQLGLSCWGLYIITQSLNTAQCENNLRGATCQWLGCCVRISRLWKQPVVDMLCCIPESDSGTNVVWAIGWRIVIVWSAVIEAKLTERFSLEKSPAPVFYSHDNALWGLFNKLS